MRACALVLAFVVLAPGSALAGSQSGGEPQFELEEIARLAKKLEHEIAAQAAAKALPWGYKNVYHFPDSVLGWREAGYPIETGE